MIRSNWDKFADEAARQADADDAVADDAERPNTARLYYTITAAWRAALRLLWCTKGDEEAEIAVEAFARLQVRLQRFSEINRRDERLREWSGLPRNFGRYFGRNALDAALQFARDVHRLAASIEVGTVDWNELQPDMPSRVVNPECGITLSDCRTAVSNPFPTDRRSWNPWLQAMRHLLPNAVLPNPASTLADLEGVAIAFQNEMETEAVQLLIRVVDADPVKSPRKWPPDDGWYAKDHKVAVLGNVWSPRPQHYLILDLVINAEAIVTSERLIEALWREEVAAFEADYLKKLRGVENDMNKKLREQLGIRSDFKVLVRTGQGKTASWTMAAIRDLRSQMPVSRLPD